MGENNAPPANHALAQDPSSAARPAPGRAAGGSVPPSSSSSTTTITTTPGAPPPGFTFTHDASLSRFAVPKADYLSARDLPWDGIATGALVFSSSSSSSSSGAPSSADDFLSTPAGSGTGSASGVDCAPSLSCPQQQRVLLVQRAAHDSWPLRWEPPGGAVDAADASILHGCARELWEETGLRAVHFARLVGKPGGEALLNSTRTRTFGKFLFVVHVAPTTPPPPLLLDGEDHQQQQQQGQQGHHGDVEELLLLPRVTLDPNEHADHVWATRDEVRRGEVGEEGQQQQQQRPRRIEVVSEGTRNLVLQSFEGQRCREEQAA